jgi:hypothetical protein
MNWKKVNECWNTKSDITYALEEMLRQHLEECHKEIVQLKCPGCEQWFASDRWMKKPAKLCECTNRICGRSQINGVWVNWDYCPKCGKLLEKEEKP